MSNPDAGGAALSISVCASSLGSLNCRPALNWIEYYHYYSNTTSLSRGLRTYLILTARQSNRYLWNVQKGQCLLFISCPQNTPACIEIPRNLAS